mmetsp:Transcript_22208/g.41883  ORF Transcript_22208/g.41883 Transcript_22208/m.41883 type:complete len:180 (-) Transcript_22208:654-1193(-)
MLVKLLKMLVEKSERRIFQTAIRVMTVVKRAGHSGNRLFVKHIRIQRLFNSRPADGLEDYASHRLLLHLQLRAQVALVAFVPDIQAGLALLQGYWQGGGVQGWRAWRKRGPQLQAWWRSPQRLICVGAEGCKLHLPPHLGLPGWAKVAVPTLLAIPAALRLPEPGTWLAIARPVEGRTH